MSEAEHRQRARHVDGVEHIAKQFELPGRVSWEDPFVWLLFRNKDSGKRVSLAFGAANALWQREVIALDLPARIGVRFVSASSLGPDGALRSEAKAEVLRFLQRGKPRHIVASEDFLFSISSSKSERWAPNASPEATYGPEGGDPVYLFPSSPSADDPGASDALTKWRVLQKLATSDEVALLRYVGLRLTRKEPPVLRISDVFVEPSVDMLFRPSGADPHADRSSVARKALSVRAVLKAYRHLIVLGDPGSGKTLLLKWLAQRAGAAEWSSLTGEVGPRLPLLFSAARLASVLRSAREASQSDVLLACIGEPGRGAGWSSFLQARLQNGDCAVLVDGLDEVSEGDRELAQTWFSAFAGRYPRNVFVSTSRIVGFSGERVPEDSAVVMLRPFGEAAVATYVFGFTRAYIRWEHGHDDAAAADAEARAFLSAIRSDDRLALIARSPFILSTLVLAHRAEGRLPRHRVQAYELFLRALCETWGEARRLAPSGESVLGKIHYEEEAVVVLGGLALEMHDHHPSGVAPSTFVRGTLEAILKKTQALTDPDVRAAVDGFFHRAAWQVQVLVQRGPDAWGFSHLTFQEFFVAVGLHAQERFEEMALLHLLESRWQEIVRLGVSYLALVQKRPVAAARFVERVLSWKAAEPWTDVGEMLGKHNLIAALLAADIGDALPVSMQQTIAERFAIWVCEGPFASAKRLGASTEAGRVTPWLAQLRASDFARRLQGALRKELESGSPEVRAEAVSALSALGQTGHLDGLVALIAQTEDARFDTLLWTWASPEEADALRSHPSDRVRRAAETYAARSWSQRETMLALRDLSPEARWAFLSTRMPRNRTEYQVEFDRLDIDFHLAGLLRDGSRATRREVVQEWILVAREHGYDNRVEEGLWALLPAWDPDDKPFLAELLAYGSDASAERVFRLCTEAVNANDARWLRAMWALGRVASPGGVPGKSLLLALEDIDPAVRAVASCALTWLLRASAATETPQPSVAFAAVRKGLDSQEVRLKIWILRALAALAAWMPFSEDVFLATQHANTEVRAAAFEAVRSGYVLNASLREPGLEIRRRSKDTLRHGLEDPHSAVRAICLCVLPELAEHEAESHFLRGLGDSDEAVRAEACKYAPWQSDVARSLLEKALSDPSPDVRLWALHHAAAGHCRAPLKALVPFLEDPDATARTFAVRALSLLSREDGLALAQVAKQKPIARAAVWGWAERWGFVFDTKA